MDIIISKLPKYVNQFAPTVYDQNPSLFRCGTAAGAICVDFQYPNQFDPYKVEHDAYVKLVGPDTPQDTNGVTRVDMDQFFKDYNMAIVDMNSLVDHCIQIGNFEPLHLEMEAQNRQGVIQLIGVVDESFLINDANGQSLHPNLHYGHCIVRLGFSDNEGYGLYFDPANPLACTDPTSHTYKPVKITWDSVVKARPALFCYAIMPPGVKAPPAGFSFQTGTWPPPQPTIDVEKVLNNLNAIASVGAQLNTIAGDLAKDIAALKQAV